MAYTLQAIIGDEVVLRGNRPKQAMVVSLTQGKGMIPLHNALLKECEIPFLPLTDGGLSGFEEALTAFVQPLIGHGKFAYVEAEFFGGAGTQACITWDTNGNSSEVLVDSHAINTALRFLGVFCGESHDEFDALGLGQHRGTEAWLHETNDRQS